MEYNFGHMLITEYLLCSYVYGPLISMESKNKQFPVTFDIHNFFNDLPTVKSA